jgi:hypothetical protein
MRNSYQNRTFYYSMYVFRTQNNDTAFDLAPLEGGLV